MDPNDTFGGLNVFFYHFLSDLLTEISFLWSLCGAPSPNVRVTQLLTV